MQPESAVNEFPPRLRVSELSELAALRGLPGCGRPIRLPVAGPDPHAGEPRLLSSCPSPSPGRRRASPRQRRVQPARCVASAVSMASYQQSRIQAYLEKNKIGPLFEVRHCGGRGAQPQADHLAGRGNGDERAGGAPLWLQVTAVPASGPGVLEHSGLALPCSPGRTQVSAAGPSLSLAGKFEPSDCPALQVTPKTLTG